MVSGSDDNEGIQPGSQRQNPRFFAARCGLAAASGCLPRAGWPRAGSFQSSTQWVSSSRRPAAVAAIHVPARSGGAADRGTYDPEVGSYA